MPSRPELASTSPGRSSGTCAPRLSVRRRGTSAAAASPTGTLIQKIQCQSSHFDEDAAEQRSERDAEAGDRRPQAERGGAALGREGRRQQRQRERHEQRGAEALDGARDDELREVRRERPGGRGSSEHEQPGDQHAPAAVAVAERGAREDEDGEDEDVRVHDPLQAIDRDSEIALHRRQRRDDDEVVEGDHEERGAGQGDGPDMSGAGGQAILRHVR